MPKVQESAIVEPPSTSLRSDSDGAMACVARCATGRMQAGQRCWPIWRGQLLWLGRDQAPARYCQPAIPRSERGAMLGTQSAAYSPASGSANLRDPTPRSVASSSGRSHSRVMACFAFEIRACRQVAVRQILKSTAPGRGARRLRIEVAIGEDRMITVLPLLSVRTFWG